uniref:Uncharacterized protein n=1 Tax=Arundo donax TaxID=35708 RepID=A0A0A8YTC2_ARUDO
MEGEVDLVYPRAPEPIDLVYGAEQLQPAQLAELETGSGSVGCESMKLDLELQHRPGAGDSRTAAPFGNSYLDLVARVAPQDFTQHTSGAGHWNSAGYPVLQSMDSSQVIDCDSYLYCPQTECSRSFVGQEYGVPVSRSLGTIEENSASGYFPDEDNGDHRL